MLSIAWVPWFGTNRLKQLDHSSSRTVVDREALADDVVSILGGEVSGAWRPARLEHAARSQDEPIQVCRPRWPVNRARARSKHFHARMECRIACRRFGRLGPEALRVAIPLHWRATECDLAMGLRRAARQWPPLHRSRPGRECRRIPRRRRGVG